MKNLLNACALVALLAASCSAYSQNTPLTLAGYLDFADVGDAHISPDGKRVVYMLRTVDKINDLRQSAMWLVNADGSGARSLGKGAGVGWAPDSRRIAYVGAAGDGTPGIFVRDLNSSDAPLQVVRDARWPGNLAWSADGRTLAFTMLVPRVTADWQLDLPGRPAQAKWAAEPRFVERLVFRRDGVGFLDDGRMHIFTVAASGGAPPRQRTQGDRDFGGGPDFPGTLSWTPDGREIVFSTFNPEHWEYPWRESDVHAIDVTTGGMRQLTTRKGPDFNPVVSPDGRWVAYGGYDWSDDSYIPTQLYVAGIDGSNPHSISAWLDRSIYPHPYGSQPRSYWWAKDSSGLYFNVPDRGATNLYFASRSGAVRQVTQGDHSLTVTDINERGTAVGTLTSYQQPSDVAIFDVRSPRPRRITAANDALLRGVRLGAVEEIWYRSTDDLQIQGWIIKPPDFDPHRKYPLVLNIHGGPHWLFRKAFDYPMQEHAANGYVVLYVNPRGSTSYGAAFGNAINHASPGKDFDDLMRGVDAAIARGYVDEKRLFVYGCSGGGELTAWIVGHTDRFAAASANCAVTNNLSFVGMTDGASFYWNYRKMFWEDPSEHLERSPIMYVGNVKTPTMLMTGELDLNTPMAQAEDFYRALKLRGVPTVLVRMADEYHGPYGVRPSNFLRHQLLLRRWFERHQDCADGACASVTSRQRSGVDSPQ
jgi:dipeptidyl aminopeptidase/acylaminoacyl peptidase